MSSKVKGNFYFHLKHRMLDHLIMLPNDQNANPEKPRNKLTKKFKKFLADMDKPSIEKPIKQSRFEKSPMKATDSLQDRLAKLKEKRSNRLG